MALSGAEELDLLRQQLLDMAARVEQNIDDAIDALRSRDHNSLEKVIQNDTEVDLAELQIDEKCVSLLALRQPVARDLRFIVTTLKIVKDLERVGDIAKNIAKHGLGILREKPLPFPGELGRMAETSKDLLRRALDAFVQSDAELAYQVIDGDDTVDMLHKQNVRHFIDMMVADQSIIGPMTQFLAVNKFLERIGDHSSNIAAMVVFMIKGRDVRHPKKQRLLNTPIDHAS
jgi:phosphate transport system protein